MTIFGGFSFSLIFWFLTLSLHQPFFQPFSVQLIVLMTYHGSAINFLQFKTVFRTKTEETKILTFSKTIPRNSPFFAVVIDLFHYFSHVSSKYNYFNEFLSSKACLLEVSVIFSPRKWKIKTLNSVHSSFWHLKQCKHFLIYFDISLIALGLLLSYHF